MSRMRNGRGMSLCSCSCSLLGESLPGERTQAGNWDISVLLASQQMILEVLGWKGTFQRDLWERPSWNRCSLHSWEIRHCSWVSCISYMAQVKNLPGSGVKVCNAGQDQVWFGESLEKEISLEYSCKSHGQGACWATVHGVAESDMT